MKQVLAILAVVLGSSAQAAPHCVINGQTGRDTLFDRQLKSEDFTQPKMFVLDPAATQIQEFRFEDYTTSAQWQKVQGKTLLTIAPQANGEVGIGLAHIDIQLKDNALPMIAMANGYVGEDRTLSLTSPLRRLSVVCLAGR